MAFRRTSRGSAGARRGESACDCRRPAEDTGAVRTGHHAEEAPPDPQRGPVRAAGLRVADGNRDTGGHRSGEPAGRRAFPAADRGHDGLLHRIPVRDLPRVGGGQRLPCPRAQAHADRHHVHLEPERHQRIHGRVLVLPSRFHGVGRLLRLGVLPGAVRRYPVLRDDSPAPGPGTVPVSRRPGPGRAPGGRGWR